MNDETKKAAALTGAAVVFAALAVVFLTAGMRERPQHPIFLVDPVHLDTSPVRMNYDTLTDARYDTSDYDCYLCHSRAERVELQFDDVGDLILKEHDYITFAHGPARAANYCFNCHNRDRLDQFRTQYGRTLSFSQSSELCGSCHGVTYRDWVADAHGRTSGYWNLAMGDRKRLDCTQCHDPHDTRFPSLAPAPGPHSMRDRIPAQLATDGRNDDE